jgi:hypothetical protein
MNQNNAAVVPAALYEIKAVFQMIQQVLGMDI